VVSDRTTKLDVRKQATVYASEMERLRERGLFPEVVGFQLDEGNRTQGVRWNLYPIDKEGHRTSAVYLGRTAREAWWKLNTMAKLVREIRQELDRVNLEREFGELAGHRIDRNK
jgi:hypothetical protein